MYVSGIAIFILKYVHYTSIFQISDQIQIQIQIQIHLFDIILQKNHGLIHTLLILTIYLKLSLSLIPSFKHNVFLLVGVVVMVVGLGKRG